MCTHTSVHTQRRAWWAPPGNQQKGCCFFDAVPCTSPRRVRCGLPPAALASKAPVNQTAPDSVSKLPGEDAISSRLCVTAATWAWGGLKSSPLSPPTSMAEGRESQPSHLPCCPPRGWLSRPAQPLLVEKGAGCEPGSAGTGACSKQGWGREDSTETASRLSEVEIRKEGGPAVLCVTPPLPRPGASPLSLLQQPLPLLCCALRLSVTCCRCFLTLPASAQRILCVHLPLAGQKLL